MGVPASASVVPSTTRGQFESQVLANVPLCREHYRVVLGLGSFPHTDPGQFIQVSCRDSRVDYSCDTELPWREGQPKGEPSGLELMSPLALLRRPFSLAGRV